MVQTSDTYYVVRLINPYDGQLHDSDVRAILSRSTIIGHGFVGKLVNFLGSHFYFELENNDMAIIPHRWIEFMAPIKPRKEETNGG